MDHVHWDSGFVSLNPPRIAEVEAGAEARGAQLESGGMLSSLASRSCLGQDDGRIASKGQGYCGFS